MHPYEDFSSAGAYGVVLQGFECQLHQRRLVAKPRDHYADADSACLALEPVLRAWELHAEIELGLRMHFDYETAEVIDRQPDSEGITGSGAVVIGRATISATASVSRVHDKYPEAPVWNFAVSPVGARLAGELREWRSGRMRLLMAAGLILTELEALTGGNRRRAAQRLNVEYAVLSRLGALAARHDPVHGRKVDGPENPLTQEELNWVRVILPLLAMRAAATDPHLMPRLTMSDIPCAGPDRA